ncbi:MAG: hypothetical protein IPH72_08000 [Sandaracinaceae bacterium]|nr:hypothetical protein [Sandaracinaceae bacterium]MBP7683696.1 hypothetical protein [Deltaproteobacteria bacterium]
MSVVVAALMCHAPIVVPAIGAERAVECAATTRAMRDVAAEVVRHAPEVLVLITPHAPRRPRAWGVCADAHVQGDFGRFGHAAVGVALPGAADVAQSLAAAGAGQSVAVEGIAGHALDHGAVVPLWFLAEAGYAGRTLVVALPYPGAGSEARFGRLLRDVAEARGERWAVVASGDMSHRLRPDAPAGFHPRAIEFDSGFVAALRSRDYARAVAPDPALQELAGEDVVQSTCVAAAAVGFEARGARVLAYEGPFGVGYCEAVLYSNSAESEARS